MRKLRNNRIPQGHGFGRFGIPDRQLAHRRLHHDQLRLGIDEETLSMNAQEKKHSSLSRQYPDLIAVAPGLSDRVAQVTIRWHRRCIEKPLLRNNLPAVPSAVVCQHQSKARPVA